MLEKGRESFPNAVIDILCKVRPLRCSVLVWGTPKPVMADGSPAESRWLYASLTERVADVVAALYPAHRRQVCIPKVVGDIGQCSGLL